MKLATKFLCVLLTVCMLLTGTLVVSAKADELYLEDIRIVYADSYEEAQKVLQNTEFKEYSLLNYNLNATATKVDLGLVTIGDGNGVFLAYKTTTNVDDAITDIAIMQMDGGYRMGNYQEMLKKSLAHYEEVGETYRTAINYMIEAYYAGDFRATAAYRQLELYKDGERKDGDSGMTLGALFETQPGADTLAKMFLEGNMYVIRNVRSLIAMGVSYNEDGMTYLEKVTEAAAEMDADSEVFAYEGYEDLAEILSKSLITFREMLKEHAAVEDELSYEDEELSDLDLEYAEHQALAAMFRSTPYLAGKTLYDFCLSYYKDDSDFSSLYPLVHALNDGQKAVATAGSYYDVIRYSVSDLPEAMMHEEICKMEEAYANQPFNLYAGVDRSIYKSSFALTTEAYRADVSSDKGFAETVYAAEDWQRWGLEIGMGAVGTGLVVWSALRFADWAEEHCAVQAVKAAAGARANLNTAIFKYAKISKIDIGSAEYPLMVKPEEILDDIVDRFVNTTAHPFDPATVSLQHQNMFLEQLNYASQPMFTENMPQYYTDILNKLNADTQKIMEQAIPKGSGYEYGQTIQNAATSGIGSKLFTIGLYAVGAAMMAYSAYSYASEVYNYYNPDYSDIPASMVDLVVNEFGDRYIKYDAATMVTLNEKTKAYDPADLNAFGGQRWNALYFTKSYEAGKPLLASASSFKVSTQSNAAPKKHLAVHRFGESVCYDLNKHNFEYEDSIYLSIAQSDEQKSVITEVPEIVGSMISSGLYFLTAGLGIAGGAVVTIITQKSKKGKNKDGSDETEKSDA